MTTPIHSDSAWRDEFITAAARLIFVNAYADYVENDGREDGYDYATPGAREDWMDYAPATPINAYVLAGELWASVEAANKLNMYALGARAAKADGDTSDSPQVNPDEFGTGLAWMYMGAGPSWFDDHATCDLEVPYTEISGFTFDIEAYRVGLDPFVKCPTCGDMRFNDSEECPSCGDHL